MSIEPLAPAVPSDLTSLKDCAELLKPTGHPVHLTTLRRWLRRHGVKTVKFNGQVYVSFSDVLEVHRDEVRRQQEPL
ncbi:MULTISPECIES: hypothetical protein [unclassified Streptomyces]|uniref:hypothetical protein n=1 Tax=unclassified Streptomyces TaxID=2593676 RepID=UPI00340E3BBF